jgi:hypothetical protein
MLILPLFMFSIHDYKVVNHLDSKFFRLELLHIQVYLEQMHHPKVNFMHYLG